VDVPHHIHKKYVNSGIPKQNKLGQMEWAHDGILLWFLLLLFDYNDGAILCMQR
jgi:hypothetical protein